MDFVESSNILISGATGYLGRNLLKALRVKGYPVFALVRGYTAHAVLNLPEDRCCRYTGNVNELIAFCRQKEINTVIHMAAYQATNHSAENIDEYVQANISLGMHLLEALKENGQGRKQFICVGTNWQHYEQEQYRAVNLYAATKEAFDKILDYYADAFLMKAITLELYETYGPFDDRNKIVNLFLKQRDGELLGMSPGEQKLDMLYITDVMAGFVHALEYMQKMRCGAHVTYCLSTGEYFSIKEIAALFEKVFEKNLHIQFGDFGYKQREMMVPYQKGLRLPGWSRKYSLEDGLKDMRERIQNENG